MPANSLDPVLVQLRGDRTRGASELARWCVQKLGEQAAEAGATSTRGLYAELIGLAEQLGRARPSMRAIRSLADRWIAGLPDPDTMELERYRREASTHAERLIRSSELATSQAAEQAADLIGPGRTVITHSLSSTVLACLTLLGRDVRVIVTASDPPGEGRVLAKRLSEAGIEVDFISDQQMALFVSRADVALVGADAVASDGSVVNKAGTRLLALAARDEGVPFYVCFESLKRGPFAPTDVEIEIHDSDELGLPPLHHVTAHNVYFDVTTPELIDAWISEDGVLTRP